MTISEYITALEALRAEHGELRVTKSVWYGVDDAHAPTIQNMKVLRQRERKHAYVMSFERAEDASRIGEKVCAL